MVSVCITNHVTSIINIPTLTTRRRSGTCTPMPAQSVLTKTWIFLQEVSACLRNYLQCSDPLKKPAITLSLSSLSSSPPTLAISALLGILYLEPSSSHLRRSHPAVRFNLSVHFMQELYHRFLIAHRADLLLPCPVGRGPKQKNAKTSSAVWFFLVFIHKNDLKKFENKKKC